MDIAEANGTRLVTGAKVTAIETRGRRFHTVKLSDGSRFRTRAVVSTLSIRDTIKDLVGESHFPEHYLKRVRAIRSSLIAVQAKIALDRVIIDAGCLVGGTPLRIPKREWSKDALFRSFDDIMAGRLPQWHPIYCPVPTHFASSLAPKGCQLLTICSVAPTTDIALVDPSDRWIEAMLDTLYEMVPATKRHILWYDTFTTSDMERWIGKSGAPAVSTAQSPGQVGPERPSIRTPIPGLYFAGDNAGGRGIGTELAARSGEMCADIIVNEIRNHLI